MLRIRPDGCIIEGSGGCRKGTERVDEVFVERKGGVGGDEGEEQGFGGGEFVGCEEVWEEGKE